MFQVLPILRQLLETTKTMECGAATAGGRLSSLRSSLDGMVLATTAGAATADLLVLLRRLTQIPQSREDLTHSLSLENWMESLTAFAMDSIL